MAKISWKFSVQCVVSSGLDVRESEQTEQPRRLRGAQQVFTEPQALSYERPTHLSDRASGEKETDEILERFAKHREQRQSGINKPSQTATN